MVQRFSRKAMCAPCTETFTAQQRENGTRIVAPIGLGACVVTVAATVFPLIHMPGLALLGIFAGAGAGLGLVSGIDARARKRFCHGDRPALPVAHTDARRLAYARLKPIAAPDKSAKPTQGR